jgi:tetratricopeptide (TPR) repeat protein
MTRIASTLSLVLFSMVFASSAFADKPMSKTAKEKAAKKACAMGDFQKGADILTDLFVETNDTTYVYNQARCYQQNNRWEQAISRFREFLRKAKDLSESDRIDTDRQIADCEASLAKVSPPPVAPLPPAPVAHVETPPPAPEPSAPEVSSTPAPQPPADGSRGKGLRVTGVILAVVGVAAIGTGVGLALKSNGLSTKTYSQSREDERASLKTWGLGSYGVGAAAIATGAILYIVGWPSEPSSGVAFLPVVAPDGASVLLKGRF